MSLQNNFIKVKSLLPGLLKGFRNELFDLWFMELGENMTETGKIAESEQTWSPSSKLRSISGTLKGSFMPPQKTEKGFKPNKYSLTKLSSDDKSITMSIASAAPYASVHERGMFIKSKGKMHTFFWAMYFKTKNKFYKIMALSVLKRGGVRIKKRPYFKKTNQAFENSQEKLINDVLLRKIEAILESA